MHRLSVVQAGLVWSGQPGIAETPGKPAFRGFQQAFFGDLLDGGKQRQVQLMRRDVAGNQLEHNVTTVRPLLTDQHPVFAALPAHGQTH